MAITEWKNVSADFGRGTAALLGASQEGFNSLAKSMHRISDTIENKQRYEAEQARQKILDDRAAKVFARQEQDWARADEARKQEIQGMKMAANATNIGSAEVVRGKEKDFREAIAPKEQAMLEGINKRINDLDTKNNTTLGKELQGRLAAELSQGAFNPATGKMDRPLNEAEKAEIARLTTEQFALEKFGSDAAGLGVDQYKSGAAARGLLLQANPALNPNNKSAEVTGLEYTTPATTQNIALGMAGVGTGTQSEYVGGKLLKKGVEGKAPGSIKEFLATNKDIAALVTPNVPPKVLKDMPMIGNAPTDNPLYTSIKNVIAGDNKPILVRTPTGHGSYSPINVGNLADNTARTVGKVVTTSSPSLLGAAVGSGGVIAGANELWKAATDSRTPNYGEVVKNPQSYKPEVLKEALLHTPGMTKVVNRPGSSVRDTVLNDKGAALLSRYDGPKNIAVSTLDKFNALPRDKQVAEILNVTADKDKEKVKSYLLGRPGTQDVYSEGKVITRKVPGVGNVSMSEKVVVKGGSILTPTGTKIDLKGASPEAAGFITKAYEAYAKSVADIGMPQDVADGFKKVMQGQLSKHGVTGREANLEGILKEAGADGKLTPQQERQVKLLDGKFASLVEQGKLDLDTHFKQQQFNLELTKLQQHAKEFAIEMAFKQTAHKQNLAASKASNDKLPIGWTYDRYTDPKTGKVSMVPVETVTLNEAAKQKILQNTPAGRAAERELERKDYEAYKLSANVDWGFDKKVKPYDEWVKTKPLFAE